MNKPKHTTDGEPPDPGYWDSPAPKPVDPKTGQHKSYWVLPESERAKGFVRPYRDTYVHLKCGTPTPMSRALAETFACSPTYYGSTFCCGCKGHYPVNEFVWKDSEVIVGT